MLVYHTSDQCFETPDVLHSRAALDFGKGFYVTRLREQAEKYSQRFLRAWKDAFPPLLLDENATSLIKEEVFTITYNF